MSPDDFFHDEESRIERYEKRRKQTKNINRLLWVSGILAVLLISFFIFNEDEDTETASKSDDPVIEEESQSGESQSDQGENEEQNDSLPDSSEDETDNQLTENDDEMDLDRPDSSDEDQSGEEMTRDEHPDDNVQEVIVKDWEPVGTEQEEPHVTTYDKNSLDWQEMLKAIRYATGLQEGDMIPWWVENGGGPQKVKATVTNNAQNQIYRVYVEWVTEEGWMPVKVEVLKENDQKYRFESNGESEEE